MSVNEKWTLYCAVVGAVQVNQVKDFDVDPQIEKFFEYGGGSVDPTFVAFDGDNPVVRFASTAIKRLLTAINVNDGQALADAVTCDLYFQQIAKGGTRLAGATGLRVRVGNGIAVVAGIQAQDGQGPAVAMADVHATSVDGETGTLEITANVALPTLVASDQLYTVGPARLGGVEVGAVESFAFDPRINVRRNRGDGAPFRSFAYISRRGSEQDGPSVMVTSRHLSWAVNGTILPVSAGDFIALRAMKAGAHREPLASLKHIKFTPNAGATLLNRLNARDGDEGLVTLDVSAARTPTLPAFSVATDVALAA